MKNIKGGEKIKNISRPKFMVPLILLALTLIFCAGNVSAANTIYVNATGNDDTGNGSINNPYHTIGKGMSSVSENGTIRLANGKYSGTGNTELTISKSRSIVGESQKGTVINGQNTNWIFQIMKGVNFTIQNLTITKGKKAIKNYGTLNAKDCTFNGNKADYGGAIYNNGTITLLSNCAFNDNEGDRGGTVYNEGIVASLSGCTFSGNTARYGGAIHNKNKGTLSVNGSSFENNRADYGSAIYNEDATLTVNNSYFANNVAKNKGTDFNGFIYNKKGSITVEDNVFV